MTDTQLRDALQAADEALQPHSETARLDAQVLLAHILQVPRTWVLIHPEAHLSAAQSAHLHTALQRLRAGEPLPYVLGEWEFYGRTFHLTPEVLIPRPETEHLVEAALEWLDAHPAARRLADVGTGSGCIAVTLAAERPALQVTALDISAAVLRVARRNACRHAAGVRFIQADLLAPLAPHACDLICANLPYIPTATLHGLEVYGKEPTLALDGGPDGLDLIRRLLTQAESRLASEGALLLEIEATQGESAPRAARGIFPNAHVDVLPDLAGRPRLLRVLV
ncbi:MAG: peptide chain release factor N(5)-glutamine methyltransferase [Anaerolineales bacterium]